MSEPMSDPLCILTVHAHPDDEASKGAPTLAMYKAQGVHTVLVCCTGGEEGDINNKRLLAPGGAFHGLDDAAMKAKLAEVRPLELAKSVDIIGFDECVMLGYRDSGMKDSDANNNPASFHAATMDEATGRLVAIIRRTRPQILVTYNDDHSGYPHPDHVKVHEISVLAWERAGDLAWYPELGEPYAPLKLYYTVWAKARLLMMHEALLTKHGHSPFNQRWLERAGQDERITTRIDVGDYLWARSQSLLAHETQIDPDEPWWFGLSDDELAVLYPWEDWVLAASRVDDVVRDAVVADTVETDLFEGIAIGAHA
jgi:mycothiol S-conjugate amidase